MQVSKIEYEMLFNTGNYENERIKMEAVLEEDDNEIEAGLALREAILSIADQIQLRHSHKRMPVYEE